MGYVFLALLIVLLVSFIIFMKDLIKKRAGSSNDVVSSEHSFKELDLSKWRGGVRYPAGYYKEKSDFYNAEKKIRYSK